MTNGDGVLIAFDSKKNYLPNRLTQRFLPFLL